MKIQGLFYLLEYQAQHYPQTDAFAKKEKGQWIKYSTQETVEHANKISLGLLELGIKKDDKVAIISINRPEWNFVDYGIQQIGAVSVPMYPTITIKDYQYIFQDAGVRAVFVADEQLYLKVKEATKELTDILEVYTFDEVRGAKHWSEILSIFYNIHLGHSSFLEFHQV